MLRAGRPAALALLLTLAACGGDTVVVPEPVAADRLQAVGDRISDEAIRSDLSVIENLRKRVRALNDTGRWPMDNYHICKAQAWIDFAEVEYTDNDRSEVIEHALQQARELLAAMEAGSANISTETRMPPESMVLRQDLWDFVAKNKQSGNAKCLDCNVARLEVQLIAAGHDHKELGRRHASSGILAAERLARAVRAGTSQCPIAIPAPTPVPVVVDKLEELRVPAVVHFAYDSATLSNETVAVLARISQVLRDYPQVTVRLVGHADHRGSDGYNDALSARRAKGVLTFLITSGVANERISQDARGKRESLQAQQEASALRKMALDRRVELQFENLPPVITRTERQEIDVQADR